jgi:hypothetical protein
MADTGYSVFAPYATVAPGPGEMGRGGGVGLPRQARNDQPAAIIRTEEKRCDHQFQLSSLPPTLVKRTPAGAADEREDPSTRRTKIWEFSQNLHCSIIGTCLSTGELRQALAKAGLARADWTDHELHHKAVSLAARHDQAARLLHKALDRRHKLSISQFGKAKTEAELIVLWRDAVKRGDIPGAYWAALTHPAGTQALVRLAFGEVHMLSHLVGAANRADIRRLCDLEAENAALAEKLRRQQEALHQAVMTRDASIRDLRESLRQKLHEEAPAHICDEAAAFRALISDLEKRLTAETRRRAAAENRLTGMRDELARERSGRATLEAETALLRVELGAVEAMLCPGGGEASGVEARGVDARGVEEGTARSDAAGPVVRPEKPESTGRMDGLSLLYVGGRPSQIAHLRDLAESLGAKFLHHDGGIEHHPDLLAGLTSRADAVLFPVDCVSHDAALMVKRLCRQADKRFFPLRSSGATSFLAALRQGT